MKLGIFLVFVLLFLSGCAVSDIGSFFGQKAECGNSVCEAEKGETFESCSADCAMPCEDSDGGKAFDIVGTVSVPNASDSVDKCFNEIWLIEKFCNGVEKRVAQMYYECENGCAEAKCLSSENALECFDSDSGKSEFVFGYAELRNAKTGVQIGTKKFDSCSDNKYSEKEMVEEVYCENGKIRTALFECDEGCSYGACKSLIVSTDCVDTDGGKDFFTKGYVSNNKYKKPVWDSCSELGSELSEKYCNSKGEIHAVSYICPGGCEDGRCKTQESEKYYVTQYIENLKGIGPAEGEILKIRIDGVSPTHDITRYDANLFLSSTSGVHYGPAVVSENDFLEDAFVFQEGYVLGDSFLVEEIGMEYVSWLGNKTGYVIIKADRSN